MVRLIEPEPRTVTMKNDSRVLYFIEYYNNVHKTTFNATNYRVIGVAASENI